MLKGIGDRARSMFSRDKTKNVPPGPEETVETPGVESAEAEAEQVVEVPPEPTEEQVVRAVELHKKLEEAYAELDRLDQQNYTHGGGVDTAGYDNPEYQKGKTELQDRIKKLEEEIDGDPGVKEAEERITKAEKSEHLKTVVIPQFESSIGSLNSSLEKIKARLGPADINRMMMSEDDIMQGGSANQREIGKLESKISTQMEKLKKAREDLAGLE